MKLLILTLLLAILATLSLAAPTTSSSSSYPSPEDQKPQPRDPLGKLLSTKLADAQSAARIAASYHAHVAQTRISWLARILHSKDKSLASTTCFCAGGSLCCYGGPGQVDCNLGNCSI